MPKYAVKVTIWSDEPLPEEMVADHVAFATRSWGGGGDPESPFWPTNLRVRAESRGYYADTEEMD